MDIPLQVADGCLPPGGCGQWVFLSQWLWPLGVLPAMAGQAQHVTPPRSLFVALGCKVCCISWGSWSLWGARTFRAPLSSLCRMRGLSGGEPHGGRRCVCGSQDPVAWNPLPSLTHLGCKAVKCHFILLTAAPQLGTAMMPITQMQKLRPKKLKSPREDFHDCQQRPEDPNLF